MSISTHSFQAISQVVCLKVTGVNSLACLLFSRLRLESLLHGLEVSKLVGIFTQAPSHDATELLLGNDLLELAGNQRGGIPSPEDVVLLIEVVLATSLLVSLAVLFGLAP